MSDAPFEAVLDGVPPDVVLHLVGELDIDTTSLFGAGLAALVEQCPPTPVIDLSRLQFLGSAGLGALLQAHRELPGLVLRGVRPAQQRVFEVAGVAGVLRVEPATADT